MEWSGEVLVTRSELDEKRARMAELEQQVSKSDTSEVLTLHTTFVLY